MDFDDIITIIIYFIILIFGAIAGSKKKKPTPQTQKTDSKDIKPVTIEEIFKELGIPVEKPENETSQNKEIYFDIEESKKEFSVDQNYYKPDNKKQEIKYGFNNYETLEKIDNEIQSLEVNEPLTIQPQNLLETNEPYKTISAYKIDENHIARTEINNETTKKVSENELISFLIKNPQSLIIYSDILKSKYF